MGELINSEIFLEALGKGGADDESQHKLVLDDKEFENKATFQMFLDVICHKSPQLALDHSHFPQLRSLWRFADKWGCEGITIHIGLLLQSWMGHEEFNRPLLVFVLAAEMYDIDTAARAIRCLNGYTWNAEKEVEAKDQKSCLGLGKENTMDPTALPWESCQKIPPAIMWAWTRAFTQYGGKSAIKTSSEEISERFVELMAAVKVSPRDTSGSAKAKR